MNKPKRSSKPPDPNKSAFSVVQKATTEPTPAEPEGTVMFHFALGLGSRMKNPAAVMLGHLGGKKGGKARAEKLSPEERSRIAREAANARWSKKK